ncbi:MAG: NADH-quinone oxidoreductase subunit L [Chloroflexi bacterium]|nr:NADH-quinone oxidoreductase subunit L [Chloroflexota bacterium]
MNKSVNRTKIEKLATREQERQAKQHHRIYCCNSTACVSGGAEDIQKALVTTAKATKGADVEVDIVPTGCMGLCSRGPLLRVETENEDPILYAEVNPELATQITTKHLAQPENGTEYDTLPLDAPFFTKQERVVLATAGAINPEKIEDYLAHDGYQALAHVLETMTPIDVCDEISKSGLRGRGGAGFPTGLKWNFTRQEEAEQKYVIVNGDEGDPGAYMDRTVMEADPHRVLEGMAICAYAIGATKGYLYIRGEYPIAIRRINRAIRSAKKNGILGKSVLGTDVTFTPEVRIGAGAFVCGEETGLIHSVEGKRGIPRMRPPYPSKSGLWGSPTVINNVETFTNVPAIINKGADWYASIGTEKSKGTKVFALTGQLNMTGLIEVPMGITLREIVYEIGGGISDGRSFKAAQTGGPSGGCIPIEHIDTPVDFESLAKLNSIMGSGGLVIIDDSTNMVDFARFFMDFCVDESCGKCLPCRVGTLQIRKKLDKIIAGDANQEDLVKLKKLCKTVKTTSLCGLGQSAPNPVLSTLDFFGDEYDSLVGGNGENKE